jgi:hypothetical protein
MRSLSLFTSGDHTRYNEIQSQDNQMMMLEIMCQKVVTEMSVLLESIEIYRHSLSYLKAYEEKRDLLNKITHLSGLENEFLIQELLARLVNNDEYYKF